MIKEINSLVLAYLGDTIYEDYVRIYLINKGISNVNELQTESIKYSSAKAQCEIVKRLISEDFFTDLELEIIKRARNHKSNSHPKNCDIVTYKYATGFEALIGYLKLDNKENRITEIMENILIK
jgi:ribonuclease-3 family protein